MEGSSLQRDEVPELQCDGGLVLERAEGAEYTCAEGTEGAKLERTGGA